MKILLFALLCIIGGVVNGGGPEIQTIFNAPAKLCPMMFSKNVIINNFAINKFWQITISDDFDSSGVYDAAFDKTNTIRSKQHGICLNGRVISENAGNTNGEIMRFRNIQSGGFASVFEHQLEIKSVCISCGLLCGHFKWHNPCALVESAVALHFIKLILHDTKLSMGVTPLASGKNGNRNSQEKEHYFKNGFPPFQAVFCLMIGAIGCVVCWIRICNRRGGGRTASTLAVSALLYICGWILLASWLSSV